jgi:hypothetical protein
MGLDTAVVMLDVVEFIFISFKKNQATAPMSNRMRTMPPKIAALLPLVLIPFAGMRFAPQSGFGHFAGAPVAMDIISPWSALSQLPIFGHL